MTTRRVSGPAWTPTHPGELIGEDVLPALGLTVSGAAERMGVTRQALHALIAGRAALSPDMALRLARLTGADPALLLRMQVTRDLRLAEERGREALAGIERVRAPGTRGRGWRRWQVRRAAPWAFRDDTTRLPLSTHYRHTAEDEKPNSV